MDIKRGAFLLLTSALAHQACVVEDDSSGDTGGKGGGAGSSASGGKGGHGGSAGTSTGGKGAGGSGNAAGANESGQGGEAGAGAQGGSGGKGGMAGAPAEGGEGGETAGGAGGEPSCDDSVGTPGDCTVIDDTNCSWERSYCVAATTYLKPKVAEAAVACMLEDPDCLTSGTDQYGCVRTALMGACADASKDTFCDYAVTMCNPNESIDAAGCHALVDGFNQAGLDLVYSCVESGCDFGLWSCVEGVQ